VNFLKVNINNNMAKPMGFEPTISGVTGRHVNRYTTAPQRELL
jgi:hypothetical protein